MIVISKIVIGYLILQGALLSLISSIGIIRLPDIYTRNHAASKSATLGIISILLGVFLDFWIVEGYMNARIILGIIFVFCTAPVAGHLISRAAYNTGIPMSEKTVKDDLRAKKKRSVQ
ncbi:monovalent cation/H(+) antiporter subunit G [Bacillus carboniphilus]|uniref:Monovalent cation/H(+) antiporter subunit G n=1 Tax=Bacillus carboniphilus TaxID=86663 RepID=A0ABY9JY40_9BACI|nr:monovalent cation/H(+) antiporter subunit G [Bacillus carboniphilus]WLR44307.1 monovalent cation/H(+) antiporter subunit G [Bacillus carboniphilus]